jgi:hypothetical protein
VRRSKLIKEQNAEKKTIMSLYNLQADFNSDVFPKKIKQEIYISEKKYGIKYKNTGCIVDLEIQAQEKYSETVKSYLEKRNGKLGI